MKSIDVLYVKCLNFQTQLVLFNKLLYLNVEIILY